VFIVVSVLYRPIEQLLSRSIADHEARPRSDRRPLRAAATIQPVLALLFAVLALLLRGPIEDGLFDGSATLFWVMVATVLAYAGSYFARGVLAGRRRFRAYGALVLLEACARVTFPVAVAIGLASGASFVALGMAIAPATSLAAVALAVGLGGRGGRAPAVEAPARAATLAPEASSAGPEFTLTRGSSYAGGVLVVMACEQTLLNAGPLLVNATEPAQGAALAGLAFNVLLIARAPLQLFQAVQASILPHLTRLRAGGREDPFRRSVTLTLYAIAAFAVAVTLALLAVGPPVMELLFGGGFEYSRAGLALMGVAMGLYLGGATLTQAALARGEAGRAAARWLVAVAAFAVLLLVPGFDDRILQVEVAFAAGALTLFAALFDLYRRGTRPPGG
jgi:O-antigen/teichoic acid export membrane protein